MDNASRVLTSIINGEEAFKKAVLKNTNKIETMMMGYSFTDGVLSKF